MPSGKGVSQLLPVGLPPDSVHHLTGRPAGVDSTGVCGGDGRQSDSGQGSSCTAGLLTVAAAKIKT